MLRTLLLVALLFLAPFPTAGASAAGMCLREETLILPGPRYALVDVVEVSTWREKNGLPGLQTRTCTDAGGRERAADEHSVGTGRMDGACLEEPWTCEPPPAASAGPIAAAEGTCVAEEPDAPVYVWSRFGAPTQYQVWRESNSMPGLQRDSCADADGRPVAADTLEVGTPEVWPPCSRPPRPIVCLF